MRIFPVFIKPFLGTVRGHRSDRPRALRLQAGRGDAVTLGEPFLSGDTSPARPDDPKKTTTVIQMCLIFFTGISFPKPRVLSNELIH